MSLLGDLSEGNGGVQFGSGPAGLTSLAPQAFKDSHAGYAVPTVPVTDAPPTAPDYHDPDFKDEKASSLSEPAELSSGSSTRYVNGSPVIQNGVDISNFVVDDRDDGDQALTFRSLVLGTIIAGLAAALSQVSNHAPQPPSS